MSDDERTTKAREIYDRYLGDEATQPLEELNAAVRQKISATFSAEEFLPHKDVFKPVIREFKAKWLAKMAEEWKQTLMAKKLFRDVEREIAQAYAVLYSDGPIKEKCLVGDF